MKMPYLRKCSVSIIAAALVSTFGISQTSKNINFNRSNGKYTQNHFKSDFGHHLNFNNNAKNNLSTSSNRLKVRLPKKKDANGGTIIEVPISKNNKYTLSYKLMFDKSFEFVRGGKLPGLTGGKAYTGGDGSKAIKNGDGWSYRLMWRKYKNDKPYLEAYLYYKDMPNKGSGGNVYGQSLGKFNVETGKWYNIELSAEMNTNSNKNGKVKLVINNKQVLSKDIRWATKASGRTISNIAWHIFRGGKGSSWWNGKDQYVYFDDVKLSASGTSKKPSSSKKPNTTKNNPPTVSFDNTTPKTVVQGQKYTVKVNAKDSDGKIQGVKLYVNNRLIREDKYAPHTWTSDELGNLTPSTYTLKAIARDDDGATKTSTYKLTVNAKSNNTSSVQYAKNLHDAYFRKR